VSALREEILVAALAALNTDAPPERPRPVGIPTAERSRTDTLNTDEVDAIVVYPVRDQALDIGGKRGPIRGREFEFLVECWATETETATADELATSYTAWVVKALEDNLLGGIVTGLREAETDYALEVGERAFCLATVTMLAEYQHRAGDLTLKT